MLNVHVHPGLCLNEILEDDSPRKYAKYGYESMENYFTGRKEKSFGWSNKSGSL